MAQTNPYEVTAAEIYEIIEESPTIRTIRVKPEKPIPFKTGQFIELTIPNIGEGPFTPSSSHNIADEMDITIMKTGFVTDHVHKTNVGDRIGIRGPYGTNYPINDWKGKDVLIMGGGVGMAPTRSLFLSLLDQIDDFNSITFLAGARTPRDMIYKQHIDGWRKIDKVNFLRSVDRVPEGEAWDEEVCLITKLLNKINIDPKGNPVVVCGPPIMMKFGTMDLLKYGYEDCNIYLSMEKKMYCGIGHCRHCVIGEYYACKDGPVFTYDTIKNEESIWE
ncbi:FAD/NAD(P)-binding protein [bacterium]|nr:FAD/NAD(P)-binding protein [bacterium]MBU1064669.1 FAD/NAD(P)-binding protein [bacterium]MBU1633247.1 FAD/NAD(P)-binding protein [bacterium]MBU1874194.1 FAD/NAD(P)-binding protein [bacterium]